MKYSIITILSENEYGQIGSEEHTNITRENLITRCRKLSDEGWEPVEIQEGEAQGTLPLKWWK